MTGFFESLAMKQLGNGTPMDKGATRPAALAGFFLVILCLTRLGV
jgi:hypothetical protein